MNKVLNGCFVLFEDIQSTYWFCLLYPCSSCVCTSTKHNEKVSSHRESNRVPHAHCEAALTAALRALTLWYEACILDSITIVISWRSLTWSLVSNIRRRPCAATRSSHAVRVAGPGSNLNFAITKLGLEARLGCCNVVTYNHPIEKSGGKFKFKQSRWARVSLL